LYSAKGSSHPETVAALSRARELIARTGNAGSPLEFSILHNSWMATLGLAHRPGAGKQGLAPEPIKLGFKRRSPRLFDRFQPGSDRRERRFGFADRQLRIGLQRQQHMLQHPWTVAVHPLNNLSQPLLAFAGDAQRPSVRAKGDRVKLRDVLLLADLQSPPSIVGGRRRLVAKDVNERGPTQRLCEGHRVPEGLGAFYRQILKIG
jgi:hypothetical protein